MSGTGGILGVHFSLGDLRCLLAPLPRTLSPDEDAKPASEIQGGIPSASRVEVVLGDILQRFSLQGVWADQLCGPCLESLARPSGVSRTFTD